MKCVWTTRRVFHHLNHYSIPRKFVKKLAIFASLTGLIFVIVAFTSLTADSQAPETVSPDARAKVVLYKTPTCGCCGKWAQHMEKAGFEVEVHNMAQQALTAVKLSHGIESKFWSCHTAVIGDYLVEGHVPAEEVIKMLDEKPEIAGLAVPGMPIGSPGMEVPDKTQWDAYNVLAFQKNGSSSVYKHIEP
jgi:hypothetical protein